MRPVQSNGFSKKPELILPAGSYQKLKYAIAYGADAVYAGPPETSLRAKYNDFTLPLLEKAIHYCHQKKKKIYITANIFAHGQDLKRIEWFLKELAEHQPDAFIISDPGVLHLIRRLKIDIPLHLSTQANITNPESVKFWVHQGIKRIIIARELDLVEVEEICNLAGRVELEIFVHGALCVSYSGRCLLSNFLTGRDANRGKCAGSCRWRYFLIEESRRAEQFEIEEDARGTYILNSRDLCLLDKIPALKHLRIDGYKVEGRTKNIFYLSVVARSYRRAIDDIFGRDRDEIDSNDMDLIRMTDNHGFTHGFLFDDGDLKQNYSEGDERKQKLAGLIRECKGNEIVIEVKNPISRGEHVLGISPHETCDFAILDLFENGQRIETAYGAKQQVVKAHIDRAFEDEGWMFGIIAKP